MEITLRAQDGYGLGAAEFGSAGRPVLVMPATGGAAARGRGARQALPQRALGNAPAQPHEVGAKAIGHFGFFRERFRDSLWREAADWLERQ
jgi:predicted alpha/beta hydrolase